MRLQAFAGVALITICAGCGSSSPSIAGFDQTFETTKCRLGSGVVVSTSGVFDIWAGSDGEFKIDEQNQAAFCVASWLPVRGPGSTQEVADVKSYFIGAGLPADQIGTVGITYSSNSSGASFSNAILHRVVNGVTVAESIAWAGMVEGQALGENVYWPTLPGSVTDELSEFQGIMMSASKLAAYRTKLPGTVIAGSIVIHHTSELVIYPGGPTNLVPLDAHACYDALVSTEGNNGTTECFLPDGTLFTFPTSTGTQ
jgi:hypothetical protein